MRGWAARAIVLLLMTVAFVDRLRAQSTATPRLMPTPASIEFGKGAFPIESSWRISVEGVDDGRVAHGLARFLGYIFARTGIPVRGTHDTKSPVFVVTCLAAGEKVQALGEDESYRLNVTGTDVHLDAPNPLGVLRGLQTFLQLVEIGPEGFVVPAVTIEDRPRFPWRGLLIDVSRHFMPIEAIKRNLDGMEALKLNVLHWHLSDDQGFRVESRRFPRLQKLSSEGMYYTQQDIRDIVQYARDRGIRVVPEFDMPGHATSWFAAYPELASGLGPYQVEHKWGVFDPAIDPSREETYRFLDGFIAEMTRLFPDRYFHIGGDEVNGKQWDGNNKIHEFMLKRGIADNHALQAYFSRRVQAIVAKHGKIMAGWDEVLQPGLPKEAVIQSWRGQASLAAAARLGYRGLLSYGYYLDLMQPASFHYSVDPLGGEAAALTAEEKQRILGGEACMWAEFVTPVNIDTRVWPRTAAVAERLWSPAEVRDTASMYSRLEAVSQYLEFLGLLHRRASRMMLQRLSGGSEIHSLQVLAQVLEPVKEYGREEGRVYDSLTPLNRMVDAIPPESDVARRFAGMVESWLSHPLDEGDLEAIKTWLTLWQNNDREVEPILESNSLLQEIVPLSRSLQDVSSAGLQALEYLNHGGRAPGSWREQQLDMLRSAARPQAELLNMIVPSVERLVAATVPDGRLAP